MSTEHVLIPKERYEKLLARMTQKSPTHAAQRSESVTSDARKTTKPESPDKEKLASELENSETDSENMHGANAVSPPKSTSGQLSTRSPQNNSSSEVQTERTLEEIQANHSDFFPPGEAAAYRPKKKAVATKENKNNKIKKTIKRLK